MSLWFAVFVVVCFFGVVLFCFVFFFFKQKTAYEIVSRDWSSDVCSSDLSENYNVLSNATGYPNCSKNLHRGYFRHAESKFAVRFAL